MKYTITIITDMGDLDARAVIADFTRSIAEGFDYPGEFTTTLMATAHVVVEHVPGVMTVTGPEPTPFSAFLLTPAESSIECIVVPGQDGPTMWDCDCPECERLCDEAEEQECSILTPHDPHTNCEGRTCPAPPTMLNYNVKFFENGGGR